MVYTDGECPICITEELHVNDLDLLECAKCNLQLGRFDGLSISVLQKRGRGKFRFEEGEKIKLCGIALARPQSHSKSPDYDGLFADEEELLAYLDAPVNTKPNLWDEFNAHFKDCIEETDMDTIKEVAESKKMRTSFYQQKVMPSIAKKMKLVHGNEEFKVDYVMSRDTNEEKDFLIPKIYIESENEFERATQELRKLCSLNSELRVLITVFNCAYEHMFKKLREWQAIIRAHKKVNGMRFTGTIALIIAFPSPLKIEFHSCSFWDDGNLRNPMRLLTTIDFN